MRDNVLRLAQEGVVQLLRFPNEYQCTSCGNTGVLLAGVRRALCPACVKGHLGLSILGTPDSTGYLVLNFTDFPVDVGEFMSGPEYKNMCVAHPEKDYFDRHVNDREEFRRKTALIDKRIVK